MMNDMNINLLSELGGGDSVERLGDQRANAWENKKRETSWQSWKTHHVIAAYGGICMYAC